MIREVIRVVLLITLACFFVAQLGFLLYDKRAARHKDLMDRADLQHRWVINGDLRGIYGNYPPVSLGESLVDTTKMVEDKMEVSEIVRIMEADLEDQPYDLVMAFETLTAIHDQLPKEEEMWRGLARYADRLPVRRTRTNVFGIYGRR